MMLLTEMVYQQNESLTSANSAADERFYIERLFILYTLSQNFQFKIEDFIRKIGHWNSAFERGRYFEPSATRPFISESLYIPIDYAGVDLEARLSFIGLDNSILNIGIGSARNLSSMSILNAFYRINFDNLKPDKPIVGDNTDRNIPNPDSVSPHARFTQKNLIWDGFECGAGYFQNYLNENFSQHIFSGHCAYSEISSDWAFMGEVLVIDQDAKKLPGLTTFEGGYVQVSKQFYWPFLNESQSLTFALKKWMVI